MTLLRFCLLTVIVSAGASAQAPAERLTPSQRALYARLLAMADTRTLDTSSVDQALVSSSDALARQAALAVGQVGARAAAPRIARLRDLVEGSRPTVAAHAAYALGLLRDTASVPTLTRALRSAPAVAAEAAWALGQIGEPGREAVVSALAAEASAVSVRVQLLLAAAKLRPVPVEAITPHLRSGDGPVVWAAAYAIARPRAPGGVRALIEAASSPAAADAGPANTTLFPAGTEARGQYDFGTETGARIRTEIARALARPAAGDSLADQALTLLTALARDAHPHVRINALRSLGSYEGRGAPLVIQGTADADANVRIAALQTLATSRQIGPTDWPALWAADTGFTYRRYVIEAAVAHGAALPAIREWAAHRDWHHRAILAAAVSGASDHGAARATLLPLVRDADARVRAAALGALTGDTARITDSVRVLAVAALDDSDQVVRALAIAALGRMRRAEDLPRVVAALQAARDDREADARVSAISYLAAAWRRDSAAFTPELRQRLAALPVAADPVTRATAGNFPPLASWRDGVVEPRPASWYRSVVDRIVVPALAGRPATAVIRTVRGPITLRLFGADAPITVNNFVTLARNGTYSGLAFHRVVPNFVAQDGDPRGDGSGGPGYAIRDELNPQRYQRGILGMALSGPDTGGSQYFITHSPQPHLDGGYTTFGRVVAGFATLDAIVQGDRIVRIEIR
ncbi:MAG TPA: peptidylprolyl isomerase [Gemmatimonadaceae bacterium]